MFVTTLAARRKRFKLLYSAVAARSFLRLHGFTVYRTCGWVSTDQYIYQYVRQYVHQHLTLNTSCSLDFRLFIHIFNINSVEVTLIIFIREPNTVTSSSPHFLISLPPHFLTSSLLHLLTSSPPHFLISSSPHLLISSPPYLLISSPPLTS